MESTDAEMRLTYQDVECVMRELVFARTKGSSDELDHVWVDGLPPRAQHMAIRAWLHLVGVAESHITDSLVSDLMWRHLPHGDWVLMTGGVWVFRDVDRLYARKKLPVGMGYLELNKILETTLKAQETGDLSLLKDIGLKFYGDATSSCDWCLTIPHSTVAAMYVSTKTKPYEPGDLGLDARKLLASGRQIFYRSAFTADDRLVLVPGVKPHENYDMLLFKDPGRILAMDVIYRADGYIYTPSCRQRTLTIGLF